MSSTRKAKANRINAKASTGPKSIHGRARAAQNARRHGLTISVRADSALSEAIKSLAREIAGDITDQDVLECAYGIAEAQMDLDRIRRARNDLSAAIQSTKHLHPVSQLQTATSHSDLIKRFILIDRYEQRALTRRKLAIRAFDLAREQVLRTQGPRANEWFKSLGTA
jgi:hypothetical protein